MAGTVLAVPLFSELTISRRGLYSPGGRGTHVVALTCPVVQLDSGYVTGQSVMQPRSPMRNLQSYSHPVT